VNLLSSSAHHHWNDIKTGRSIRRDNFNSLCRLFEVAIAPGWGNRLPQHWQVQGVFGLIVVLFLVPNWPVFFEKLEKQLQRVMQPIFSVYKS